MKEYIEEIDNTPIVECEELNDDGLPIHKTFWDGPNWGFENRLYEVWYKWFKTEDGKWDLKTTKIKYGNVLRTYL